MLSRSLLVVLAFALSGCAVGFNPDAFRSNKDPRHEPLNRSDAESVYKTCLRAEHIRCSINPSLNTLLIQGKRDGEAAQKFEAETIGNMWCSLNRVQGVDATIVFRYPNGSMIGSSCQEKK